MENQPSEVGMGERRIRTYYYEGICDACENVELRFERQREVRKYAAREVY